MNYKYQNLKTNDFLINQTGNFKYTWNSRYLSEISQTLLHSTDYDQIISAHKEFLDYCKRFPSESINFLIGNDFFIKLFLNLNHEFSIFTLQILTTFRKLIEIAKDSDLESMVSLEFIICLMNFLNSLYPHELNVIKECLNILCLLLFRAPSMHEAIIQDGLIAMIYRIEKDTSEVSLFLLSEDFDTFYHQTENYLNFVSECNNIKESNLSKINDINEKKNDELSHIFDPLTMIQRTAKFQNNFYKIKTSMENKISEVTRKEEIRKENYKKIINEKITIRRLLLMMMLGFSFYKVTFEKVFSIDEYFSILRKDFHVKQDETSLVYIIRCLNNIGNLNINLLMENLKKYDFINPLITILRQHKGNYYIRFDILKIIYLTIISDQNFFSDEELIDCCQCSLIKSHSPEGNDDTIKALKIINLLLQKNDYNCIGELINTGVLSLLFTLISDICFTVCNESIKIIFQILKHVDSKTFIEIITSNPIIEPYISILESDDNELIKIGLQLLYHVIDLTKGTTNDYVFQSLKHKIDYDTIQSFINDDDESISQLSSLIIESLK